MKSLYGSYAPSLQSALQAADEAGLVTWSCDAGVANGGKGFYVAANNLEKLLLFLQEKELLTVTP